VARRFVLLGSGDGGEWADPIFRNVAGDKGHAAVVATAQVANGTEALEAQRRYAEDHLWRAGIRTVHVPLLDRADAEQTSALKALDGAAFVYVLGGQLPPLVAALRGSRFWDEVTSRHLSYVGNSAGAMLLGGQYPTWDRARDPGLGLFPAAFIVAHWDEMETVQPGTQEAIIGLAHDDTLVGIDADTAMIGDGVTWQTAGRGGIHVLANNTWTHHQAPGSFALCLLP
jgi:cyanophycinase-like exopeptidase